MSFFHLKRGDTSPSLLYALTPTDVVLTGATVVFNMKDSAGTVVVNQAAAIVVTATGTPTVRYDWVSGDVDTAGEFLGEFEVTYSGGAKETFPNYGNIPIQIAEDIA